MSRAAGDAGMVTAETAVALPVLVVVLAAGVWVLACVAGQLRCADAAAAIARAAARGAVPAGLAPQGMQVVVRRAGPLVEVRVSGVVRPFGPLARLPGMAVSGAAVAEAEPAGGRSVRLEPAGGPAPAALP